MFYNVTDTLDKYFINVDEQKIPNNANKTYFDEQQQQQIGIPNNAYLNENCLFIFYPK